MSKALRKLVQCQLPASARFVGVTRQSAGLFEADGNCVAVWVTNPDDLRVFKLRVQRNGNHWQSGQMPVKSYLLPGDGRLGRGVFYTGKWNSDSPFKEGEAVVVNEEVGKVWYVSWW